MTILSSLEQDSLSLHEFALYIVPASENSVCFSGLGFMKLGVL